VPATTHWPGGLERLCSAHEASRSQPLGPSSPDREGGGLCVPLCCPPYLGQVLSDATPTVGVRDLGVLQVYNPLAHILVEQDGPVMTS
jgi:hypothetical protein